jgi:hypothetical protein
MYLHPFSSTNIENLIFNIILNSINYFIFFILCFIGISRYTSIRFYNLNIFWRKRAYGLHNSDLSKIYLSVLKDTLNIINYHVYS